MQNELDGEPIHILGLNEAGLEAGNAEMVEGRDLPLLQDTTADDVWGSWEVEWRDVVLLDRENRRRYVYNLTDHDLADSESYEALKQALLELR